MGSMNRYTVSKQYYIVQQQQGTTDCGLCAIAYAVYVANGAKVKFQLRRMRSHLLECLNKMKLGPVEIISI